VRQREDGMCCAYSKSDGSAYLFPRSEYARLKAEWMAGRAFFESDGFYGHALVIKLGDVIAVTDCTPESMANQREDKRQDEIEDKADEVLS
jgi:hypothetical protein